MRIFTASCRGMGSLKVSPVGGISSQSYHPASRAAWRVPAAQWPVWPSAGESPAIRAVTVTNSALVMIPLGRKAPSG